MTRALLAAAFAVLALGPARAGERDLPKAMDDIRTQIRERPPRPAALDRRLPSADLAAIAFVDYARQAFADQRIEYCAYIVRVASGFSFGETVKGDMNHCPTTPSPQGTVASVHTHPIWGPADDLSHSSQVFSEGDFRYAERRDMRMPLYLGAPAGHVLRYDPGASTCRGDMVRHAYATVRPPRAGSRGELAFKPTEFVYIEGGKSQSYCAR